MAPRKAHGQAGGSTRGGPKRGPPGVDSADAQSRLRGGFADQGTLQTSVSIAPDVEVVDVKRPSYGKEGRLIKIIANVCEASVPEGMIYQYDVQIYVGDDDKEKALDMSFNRSLFDKMQNLFQDVFTPCAVYDGKKIAFASHELDLGMSNKRQFDLMMDNGPEQPPKCFIVCLTRLSIVNSEDSKNLIAGTVVDQDITSPVLFDWYLQSHCGLKGTSQSAHYTVLHDETNFNPDALRSLAFLLCHTFVRATKSVSIPAPVYYLDAHLVCGKAKQHYDPSCPAVSDAGTSGSAEHERIMEQHKSEYKAKVHPNQENAMYWMVSIPNSSEYFCKSEIS